ncbi:hypothetical protein JCGZ_15050 [Jatropha curcas]|uniref:Uncharacterized protein n=1 Tax=Jatropha curcas TaxID=180498 RepID=A0A067LKF8_JATCU|nr:hypothetical protein JCGZ_15050 [Jatropha curcas]
MASCYRTITIICPQAAREVTHKEETVLHLAVKNNQSEAVKSLLSLLKRNNLIDDLVNCVDQDGNTILHRATARKQVQTIKLLLEETKVNGNSVNANGHTAFSIAKLNTSEADDMIIQKMLNEAQQREPPGEQIVEVESPQNEAEHAITTIEDPKKDDPPEARKSRLEKSFDNVKNGIIILASMCAAFSFAAAVSPPRGL